MNELAKAAFVDLKNKTGGLNWTMLLHSLVIIVILSKGRHFAPFCPNMINFS